MTAPTVVKAAEAVVVRRDGRRWAASARMLPPVVVGVAGLVLWEVFVKVGKVAPYVLPAPSAIFHEVRDDLDIIVKAGLASGENALVGLVFGVLAALTAALVAARFGWLGEVSAPLIAALNALPIIALAPILNNMFESTSSIPRRVVVALVVFFPVFLNTLRGLQRVDPTHQELMDSYAAGPWAFNRKVRLPGALPFFFTGLRQASSLAVIAAVVSEYFGGLQDGLGAKITSAASNTAYPRAWAFVAGACLLGLLFYLVTLLIERLSTPWRNPG
ncbi:ABC transporter permease [Actinocorallia lasiicapitis]